MVLYSTPRQACFITSPCFAGEHVPTGLPTTGLRWICQVLVVFSDNTDMLSAHPDHTQGHICSTPCRLAGPWSQPQLHHGTVVGCRLSSCLLAWTQQVCQGFPDILDVLQVTEKYKEVYQFVVHCFG